MRLSIDRFVSAIVLLGILVIAAPLPGWAQKAANSKANEFSTEAAAKAHCSTGLVVWANLRSHVYHFAGSRDYGRTKRGAYMCEADATKDGLRAAKNEKHP